MNERIGELLGDQPVAIYSSWEDYRRGIYLGDEEADLGYLGIAQEVEREFNKEFLKRVREFDTLSQNETWPDPDGHYSNI